MADVTIESAASNNSAAQTSGRAIVFTSTTVGYIFYVDGSNDMVYRKTTDSGQTWGSAVNIKTGTIVAYDVWFDQWTPGDSGTKVHVWYVESGVDDCLYRSLDTASDTLGTETTAFAGASAAAAHPCMISGTKAIGGNLYVGGSIDNGTENFFAYSTNAGSTWNSGAAVYEAATDQLLLFPGDYADTQDIDCLYFDDSATDLTLKVYDKSADSWSETNIDTNLASFNISNGPCFGGAIRHSDKHLICYIWNAFDVSTADLKVYDVHGSGSITGKTDVVTNSDDCALVGLFINQNNDDLYCAYVGKSDGSQVFGSNTAVYYKKSTDDAATWGSETAMSVSTGNYRALLAGIGGVTSRFLVAWYDDVNQDIITNYDNSIAITAGGGGGSTVRLLASMGVGT